MKTQSEYKTELLNVLHEIGAKIVGENDEDWIVHFEVNNIPFMIVYDDGISCFKFGKMYYSPLEWGQPYFARLQYLLVSESAKKPLNNEGAFFGCRERLHLRQCSVLRFAGWVYAALAQVRCSRSHHFFLFSFFSSTRNCAFFTVKI